MRFLAPLIVVLLLVGQGWAVDALLCLDTDKDGTFSIIKDSGVIDRDCDHDASVADGGTDCDDTDPRIWNGGYTTSGCGLNEYRYCDAGVWKNKPGGSTANNGCTSADIDEKTNKYFVSGAGSGTACTAGSPCTIAAVSTSGSVTVVAPAQIVLIGSTDITTSTGFSTSVAGTSAANRNVLIKDPRSTAKFNITGGSCATSCASIKINAANWQVRGFTVTGGDSTGSGGIRAEANDIEIAGNWLYDVVVANNFNGTGIYGGENYSRIKIHHNIVTDVYDPTRNTAGSDRQNVYLISVFQGLAHDVYANSVTYSRTPNTSPYEVQGGGIRIKHGLPKASCDGTSATHSYLRWNVVGRTEYSGVFTSSGCSSIEGNLMLGVSHGTTAGPGGGGGTAAWHDLQVTKNTVVSGSHWTQNSVGGNVFSLGGDPTETTVGGVAHSGNVADDSAQTTYGGGNNIAMVGMDAYGSDANYTALIYDGANPRGILTFANNCYYNSAISGLGSGFTFFKETSGGSAGPLGSAVNFANVKLTPYFFETTSTEGNPTLDNEYRVTANCPVGSIGWESQWPTASAPATSRRKGSFSGSSRKGQG